MITNRQPNRQGAEDRQNPAVQVEIYSPERIAEFLLSNAVDEEDCARAVEHVMSMGLYPASIPHTKLRDCA